MHQQYLKQARLNRQSLLNQRNNILKQCKSAEIITQNVNISETNPINYDNKRTWKKYILPEVNQRYMNLQQQKNYSKTSQKIPTQSNIRISRFQNNPQVSQCLYKSRASISNNYDKTTSDLKNTRVSNRLTGYSIKLNQDVSQYDQKQKKVISEELDQIQLFKQHLLNQNQKFLKRQVRELQKLIKNKYQKRPALELQYSQQQLSYLRNNYLTHYHTIHNHYNIQQLRYIRSKFLDHHSRCDKNLDKLKK